MLVEKLYMCWVMARVKHGIYISVCDLCSCSKQAAEMKKEESERQKRTEECLANRKKAAKYLKETIKR